MDASQPSQEPGQGGPANEAHTQQQPPSAAHNHAVHFTYIPHPHIAFRRQQGPVKVKDQLNRSSPIARLNSHLAVLITVAVGSMWAAYLFALLALVSFPSAIKSGNTIIIVAWIAQTFLQLVLLPVIIVGQNIQGAASDKRAEQTYNDAEAVLHEALQIQQHLSEQDIQLQQQSRHLDEIIAELRRAYPALGGTAPATPE
jgi:hypothetical protein